MQTLKVKILGTRPLLVHSDVFADPLNKLTKVHKQLTSKRKKTDEDHELIARSEWRGGLYFSEDIGPYLPGINIESALVAGRQTFENGNPAQALGRDHGYPLPNYLRRPANR